MKRSTREIILRDKIKNKQKFLYRLEKVSLGIDSSIDELMQYYLRIDLHKNYDGKNR